MSKNSKNITLTQSSEIYQFRDALETSGNYISGLTAWIPQSRFGEASKPTSGVKYLPNGRYPSMEGYQRWLEKPGDHTTGYVTHMVVHTDAETGRVTLGRADRYLYKNGEFVLIAFDHIHKRWVIVPESQKENPTQVNEWGEVAP